MSRDTQRSSIKSRQLKPRSWSGRIERLRAGRMGGVFALIIALNGWTEGQAQTTTGHWLTGYYATYSYGVMSTSQVDYTKLTHVIYWPVIPNGGGAPNTGAPGTLNTTPFGLPATTFSSGATDLVSSAHAVGAKALIGIGGDKNSGATAGFQLSTQPTYQATFIQNILSLVQTYGFDGVDINWEQIQPSDNSDFTTFIQNLRTALDTLSPDVHLLLTMAPETKGNGGRPDLLAQVYQDLDQINIQTYQMSGPYCGWQTWFNSPLNNGGAMFALNPSEQLPSIVNAIADYTSQGIPSNKLAMGIQFDSEVWTGGQGTSTGGVTMPGQTWTEDGNSAYCSATNPNAPTVNTVPYRQLITTLAVTPGYTVNFDSVADQSWLSYDPSGSGTVNENQDTFVSYDSPQSIAKKGEDLSPQTGAGGALGGAFIFELSGDFASAAEASQQHPLLNAAHAMQMLLPGLVTNLTATPGAGTVSLAWTAANGASSYQISYSTSSSGPQTLAGTPVSGSSATISDLSPQTQYWFQVTPLNAFGAGVAAQVTATINLITPTVTWPLPAPIPYGTPLSSIQLDATASVAGNFVYTPGNGTILVPGVTRIRVVFTPQSPYYASVTKMVLIEVTAAQLSTSDNFGNEHVGMESNVHAITFKLQVTTILTEIEVLTSGVSNLDFKNVGGGTCAVNQMYSPGSSCTVYVTFTPTVSGSRQGTVVLQGIVLHFGELKLSQDISGIGVTP